MFARFQRSSILSLVVALAYAAIACSGSTSEPPKTAQQAAAPAPAAATPAKKLPFRLVISSVPEKLQPDTETKLVFKVEKDGGGPVTDFEIVHEKLMHLIVVSNDLKEYRHLHPERQQDGTFIEKVKLGGGSYKLWAGVRPSGQEEDFNLPGSLEVGGQVTGAASLVPDKEFTKVFEQMKVTLQPSLPKLKAHEKVTLKYELIDERSSKPIDNLEPYLGAMGHLIIISEDGSDFLHAHPEGHHGHDHSHHAAPSGPAHVVGFDTEFPHPGRYKAWAQFKRDGKVIDTNFVLNVE